MQRRFKRYGLERSEFYTFLQTRSQFDFAMIQTGMTYWYPGVCEVIEAIRSHTPGTKIILGGNYATLCPDHARSLGADLVISGEDLSLLSTLTAIEPSFDSLPLWEAYRQLDVGVLRLSDGCPFKCTYCSIPVVSPRFLVRPLNHTIEELTMVVSLGASNIAFYDDALLFQPEKCLLPFLDEVIGKELMTKLHTPNALNARFLNAEIAEKMMAAGFRSFYLGFESRAASWQKKTGGKVYDHEFKRAVDNLFRAGAPRGSITCYLIAGHPRSGIQEIEDSMKLANDLGIRVMLSEFSPIPGTPDGDLCRKWVDLKEPLTHNKAFFTQQVLGEDRIQCLKSFSTELNHSL
jgi:radical SAM superfamily enzyme YgiQ (UPF0313 family)